MISNGITFMPSFVKIGQFIWSWNGDTDGMVTDKPVFLYAFSFTWYIRDSTVTVKKTWDVVHLTSTQMVENVLIITVNHHKSLPSEY
jgi:hypothetical protein